MAEKSKTGLIVIIIIVLVGIVAYLTLITPNTLTAVQKSDDAVDTSTENPKKAVRQLEDRTPEEKLGDEVKDLGDDTKKESE